MSDDTYDTSDYVIEREMVFEEESFAYILVHCVLGRKYISFSCSFTGYLGWCLYSVGGARNYVDIYIGMIVLDI